MSRRDEHTHPCDRCQAKVECSGELSRNYDGWPEVICSAVHRPSGRMERVLCEDCHEAALLADNEEEL